MSEEKMASTHPPTGTSHLFMLRVWVEDREPEPIEWRGRVQHVYSNQSFTFRDWPSLIEYVLEEIRRAETSSSD